MKVRGTDKPRGALPPASRSCAESAKGTASKTAHGAGIRIVAYGLDSPTVACGRDGGFGAPLPKMQRARPAKRTAGRAAHCGKYFFRLHI